MKKIKNISFTLLLLISSSVLAQQESILAFYNNHLNLINPAAVSVNGESQFKSALRQQWTGIKDAPQTLAASFMTPISKNLSFGVSAIRDEVFIEKQTFLAIDFSYKVKVNDDLDLFMGLKAGGNNYEVNTSGIETYNLNADPRLQPISRFNPNIGIGFYLKHNDYFISISSPKILDTKRAKNENGFATVATDQAHYYLALGKTFTISDAFQLLPTFMLRYVNGAPYSADFTTTAKFKQGFDLGITYRTDRSLAGLAKFDVNKKFAIGYAYEYSLRSELLGRANGSNEFYLHYKFN